MISVILATRVTAPKFCFGFFLFLGPQNPRVLFPVFCSEFSKKFNQLGYRTVRMSSPNGLQINSGSEELDTKISQWIEWDKVSDFLFQMRFKNPFGMFAIPKVRRSSSRQSMSQNCYYLVPFLSLVII